MIERVLKYVNPSEREGLENLISLTFVLLMFVYVVFFLGEFYGFLKTAAYRHFPEAQYAEYLVKYGVIVLLPILFTRAFLFGQDSLATGRDRFADFFRASLPSTFLHQKIGCEPHRATELWFKVFNVWKKAKHPRNPQWYATFRRTYSCRFFYLLRRWLWRAAFLFVLTVCADQGYRWIKTGALVVDEMLFVRGIFTALVVAGALWIGHSNKIMPRPTGCWARLLEIETGHHVWLEQEILRKTDGTFDGAWTLATVIEEQWADR